MGQLSPRGASHNPVDPALGGRSLSAPWRLEYIEALGKEPVKAAAPSPAGPAVPEPPSPDSAASFLREYWLDSAGDERNHVIARIEGGDGGPGCAGMILLNRFPYAGGHLLVALGEARPTLLDYTAPQRAALWRLTDLAAALMQETLDPQGINIGINQGRAAGAGVPGHLHVHLVPRWNGDTNFMTVVGRVRVIPASLEVMARRYREAWGRVRGTFGA